MEDKKKKSGMGVAALVLGILSIVFAAFWYISIPTGILGIIFGAISAKKIGSKLGKSGLITGIIGLTLCVFNYISIALLLLVANIY